MLRAVRVSAPISIPSSDKPPGRLQPWENIHIAFQQNKQEQCTFTVKKSSIYIKISLEHVYGTNYLRKQKKAQFTIYSNGNFYVVQIFLTLANKKKN